MNAKASAPAQGQEPPKYRLTEPAYINDIHYDQMKVDAGKAVIFFEGPPGYHMEPLNDAARAMVEKHQPKHTNPLDALTKLTPDK